MTCLPHLLFASRCAPRRSLAPGRAAPPFPRLFPLFELTLALALALALGVAAGCGDPTALDLQLVPDPNVTNAEALVQRLRSLKVVVDSPEGLYPAGTARVDGELQIADVDGDGLPELWTEQLVAALGRLPRIRLERGGLGVARVDLRFEGSDGTAYVAAGGVQGVPFVADTARGVEVPFNLRPLYRPPQVTQVFPEDGARDLSPRSFGSVLLIFSKRMNEASLLKADVVRVLRVDGSAELDVPASAVKSGTLGSGPDSPTTIEYRFREGLDGGTYRVRVAAAALDAAGLALDQVPMQPGSQPFQSQFTVSTLVTGPMLACTPDCEKRWCTGGGTLCSPGLICDAAQRVCLPQTCPTTCPATTVCDAAHAVCVTDCRLNGSYGGCAAGRTCDARGLCTP